MQDNADWLYAVRLCDPSDPFFRPRQQEPTQHELAQFRHRLRSLVRSRQDLDWTPDRHAQMPRIVHQVVKALHLSLMAATLYLPPELRFIVIQHIFANAPEHLVPRAPLFASIAADTLVAYCRVHRHRSSDWIGLYKQSVESNANATHGLWNFLDATDGSAFALPGGNDDEYVVMFWPEHPSQRPLGFTFDTEPGAFELRFHPNGSYDNHLCAAVVAFEDHEATLPIVSMEVFELQTNITNSEQLQRICNSSSPLSIACSDANTAAALTTSRTTTTTATNATTISVVTAASKPIRNRRMRLNGGSALIVCHFRTLAPAHAHDWIEILLDNKRQTWEYTHQSNPTTVERMVMFNETDGAMVYRIQSAGHWEFRYLPMGGFHVAARCRIDC
jgi:hypothetical protein